MICKTFSRCTIYWNWTTKDRSAASSGRTMDSYSPCHVLAAACMSTSLNCQTLVLHTWLASHTSRLYRRWRCRTAFGRYVPLSSKFKTATLTIETSLEDASFQCGVQPIDTFCFLHCYCYDYYYYYYHHHHQHRRRRRHLFVMRHQSSSRWRNRMPWLYCIVLYSVVSDMIIFFWSIWHKSA